MGNDSVKYPNNQSLGEDKVVMREVVCHKYCTSYEIDMDALEQSSSVMGAHGANRNMSV